MSKVKFDGTVSLGSIIAAAVIVVPLIGGIYLMVRDVGDIKSEMRSQGDRFEMRLEKVETAINDFKTDMAVKDGILKNVADHEVRIRELEKRR